MFMCLNAMSCCYVTGYLIFVLTNSLTDITNEVPNKFLKSIKFTELKQNFISILVLYLIKVQPSTPLLIKVYL